MITFNAAEVYEMAEQIERNGAAFYAKAASQTDNAKAAEMLRQLARMEQDHEKTFAEMKGKLGGSEKADATFDVEGEGARYLDAMVAGKVFDPSGAPAEKLTGAESLADIFKTAIGLEKDSIVFYLWIKELVPASHGQARIDDIINQEMGHITTLSVELAEVTGQD